MNKRTKDEARAKAEAILVAAEAEARSILAEAKLEAAKQIQTMRRKLSRLKVERDALAQYLTNLRAVIDVAQENLAKEQPEE